MSDVPVHSAHSGSTRERWFCPTHGLTCAQQRGSDGIWRCAPGGHNLVEYVPVEALNEFRDGLAQALAEEIRAVYVREPDAPVEVCRFHRDLAEAVIDRLAVSAVASDQIQHGPEGDR